MQLQCCYSKLFSFCAIKNKSSAEKDDTLVRKCEKCGAGMENSAF
jgi:hypothetical protein